MKKHLALIFAAIAVLPSAAFSQTSWLGTTTAWATATNWSTTIVPTSSTDVVFGNFAGSAPSTGAGARVAQNVDFTRTSAAYIIVLSAGGSLTASGALTTSLGSSDLTLRGGGALQGANLTVNSNLSFGSTNQPASGGNSQMGNVTILGTTTLNLGGVLSTANLIGTTSLGTLQMNGGTFNVLSGNSSANGTLDGGTATVNVNRLNGASGVITGVKTGTLTTTGVVAISGTVDGSFGGSITNGLANNVLSVTKSGANTQTLSGANTYTGSTTVTAGTLIVATTGALSNSSPVTVAAGAKFVYNGTSARTGSVTLNGNTGSSRATLGGTGPINVAVTLDNVGDTLAPGNSPGTMSFGVAQSWSSFTYQWDINSFTGTVAGTNFDQINIAGALALTGGPGSYVLDITSLTGGNVPGDVGGVFSETPRSWTILTSTGLTGFNAANWTVDTSHFTSNPAFQGTFSLGQSGNDLVLSYTAVPEPSTWLMLTGGLAFLTIIRRRMAKSKAV